MAGKCPKCGHSITRVNTDKIQISLPDTHKRLRGVTYACPFCLYILSVAIDPVAMKSDIVREIVSELARKKR